MQGDDEGAAAGDAAAGGEAEDEDLMVDLSLKKKKKKKKVREIGIAWTSQKALQGRLQLAVEEKLCECGRLHGCQWLALLGPAHGA